MNQLHMAPIMLLYDQECLDKVLVNIHSFQCMEEAGVDGALIVQPINHKFDHSLVTRYFQFISCLM